MLVGGKFRTAAGIAHSILELGGGTPEAPPDRLGLQQVTDGVIRTRLLELPGGFLRAVKIERIDLFENRGGLRGQRERRGGRARRKAQEKKPKDAGTAKQSQGNSHFHSIEVSHKDSLYAEEFKLLRRVAKFGICVRWYGGHLLFSAGR